jgi:hypothetical protein
MLPLNSYGRAEKVNVQLRARPDTTSSSQFCHSAQDLPIGRRHQVAIAMFG